MPLCLFAIVCLWSRWIPLGAPFLPYLVASVDEGHQIPDRDYRIVYNDAGGMHSGYFWTWIIAEGFLIHRVVVEGYSDSDVRYGDVPFPTKDVDGQEFIGFAKGRRNPERIWLEMPR